MPFMVLTIDRGNVRAIASRPGVAREFPFLAPYARKPVPGCCGQAGTSLDGNTAVKMIGNLPKARQDALKQLLGVEVIRLRIVQAGRFRPVEI